MVIVKYEEISDCLLFNNTYQMIKANNHGYFVHNIIIYFLLINIIK